MYEQKENLEKGTNKPSRNITNGAASLPKARTKYQLRKKKKTEVIENELRDERNNLKLELNALKERLSVEFNVDIEDLPETEVPEMKTSRRCASETEKLKKQLDDFGAINPMAVEAYNEMSERYTFIQGQKKDLAKLKHPYWLPYRRLMIPLKKSSCRPLLWCARILLRYSVRCLMKRIHAT
jgi:chromosome segregation protein